jgi:hypothetical protein
VQRTNLKDDDELLNAVFVCSNRPDAQITIDIIELTKKIPNGRSDNRQQWAKQIEKAIKAGICDAAIEHNIMRASMIPFFNNAPNILDKVRGAMGIATKAIAVYGPVDLYVDLLLGTNTFADAADDIVFLNIFGMVFGSFLFNKKNNSIAEKLSDTKISLFHPFIPLDRALGAVAQKYMAKPFLRVANDTPTLESVGFSL